MSRCVASTPTRVQRLLAVPREDQKMSDASQKGPSDALAHQLSRGLRGRVLKNAARSAARPSTPLGVVLRRRRRADATDHRTLPEARCTIVPLIVRSSGHSRPSRRTRSAATSVSARSSLQRGLAALEEDRPAASGRTAAEATIARRSALTGLCIARRATCRSACASSSSVIAGLHGHQFQRNHREPVPREQKRSPAP